LAVVAVPNSVSHDMSYVPVSEGVYGLPAVPFDTHQARSPQHPQMLGNKRLTHIQTLDQLVNEPGLLGQLCHYRQAGRGRQRLEQLPSRFIGLRRI
jgi:hypothetical protein